MSSLSFGPTLDAHRFYVHTPDNPLVAKWWGCTCGWEAIGGNASTPGEAHERHLEAELMAVVVKWLTSAQVTNYAAFMEEAGHGVQEVLAALPPLALGHAAEKSSWLDRFRLANRREAWDEGYTEGHKDAVCAEGKPNPYLGGEDG